MEKWRKEDRITDLTKKYLCERVDEVYDYWLAGSKIVRGPLKLTRF